MIASLQAFAKPDVSDHQSEEAHTHHHEKDVLQVWPPLLLPHLPRPASYSQVRNQRYLAGSVMAFTRDAARFRSRTVKQGRNCFPAAAQEVNHRTSGRIGQRPQPVGG
jgi:hypothetical protein